MIIFKIKTGMYLITRKINGLFLVKQSVLDLFDMISVFL